MSKHLNPTKRKCLFKPQLGWEPWRSFVYNLHLHIRENKNKYVLTYLASLVRQNVFSKVTLTFLLKGHTGNQVICVQYTT